MREILLLLHLNYHDAASFYSENREMYPEKRHVDLGADYFDKLETSHIQRRAVNRLEQLGYQVTLTPVQAAS